MNNDNYVHGYSLKESTRLSDQANTLSELLHKNIAYLPNSKVLEAGCGVGAQTIILARNSPNAHFTSIDISSESLAEAKARVNRLGILNVEFQAASIFDLPFDENSFDHLFVCFILEHLQEPVKALNCLKKVLKPGGTITVIEGDHGSAFYYPENNLAQKAINCLVEIQSRKGGNALIGRQLYPILKQADFKNINVLPCQVYCDSSRPEWVDGFTIKTFIAMVEGIKEEALKLNLTGPEEWNKGMTALYDTSGEEGTFSYTFFKGIGVK
ncbi:MAG TPA: class I SAM-dependent methyltransferase [Ignavibacteriaceae bacterium]|nr:class I SAM-dependent methyltransferase [Ignavibacteriaceae bacterium]